MAVAYPEGICCFRRTSLKLDAYGFDAEDEEAFYNHVLVEWVWNHAWEWGGNKSDPDEAERVTHPRTAWKQADNPHPQETGWECLVWQDFPVCFGKTSRVADVDTIMRHDLCMNGNSYRDHDKDGGTAKSSFYPIRVPHGYPFMYLDLTTAIRAVYIPVAQQTSKSYPDWCTYVHVNFAASAGSTITVNHPDGPSAMPAKSFPISKAHGLDIHPDTTLRLNLPELINRLVNPPELLAPGVNLYSNEANDPNLFLITYVPSQHIPAADALHTYVDRHYCEGIGFDKVISDNTGLELEYVPYEHNSWVSAILGIVWNIASGFLPPYICPLAALAYRTALVCMYDPEKFKEENVLGLVEDQINACIDTGQGVKTHLDSKKASSRAALEPQRLSPKTFAERGPASTTDTS